MWTTIAYNTNGGVKWLKQKGDGTRPATWTDAPTDITADRFGNVYVTGYVIGGGMAMQLVKYALVHPLTLNVYPDTTVYFGYGSNCVLLRAEVSGGLPPYHLTWESNPSVHLNELLVCPEITTSYTARVQDSRPFVSVSDAVKVTVIDVRCGNKNDKVQLCHKGKTICIDKESVPDHLAHGDQLGSCPELITMTTRPTTKNTNIATELTASNYPNPFSGSTTLSYQLPVAGSVRIDVYNQEGKLVRSLNNGRQNAGTYSISFKSGQLAAGVYMYRVILDDRQKLLTYQGKIVIAR